MDYFEPPKEPDKIAFSESLTYIRTLDSFLEQLELLLYKLEQLATISASDTDNWLVDRNSLKKEMDVILAEIDRINVRIKDISL